MSCFDGIYHPLENLKTFIFYFILHACLQYNSLTQKFSILLKKSIIIPYSSIRIITETTMLKDKPIFNKMSTRRQLAQSEDFSLKDETCCETIDSQKILHPNQKQNSLKNTHQSVDAQQAEQNTVVDVQFSILEEITKEQCGKLAQKTLRTQSVGIENLNTGNIRYSKQLSPNEIKANNLSEKSCTNFLFCSGIPLKPPKITHITLSQVQKCQNFDILLFRNKNTMSKMQRFITGSQFDHVAMVVQIGQCRYILQSSGMHGVSLSDFQKFVACLNRKIRSNNLPKYQMGVRKLKRDQIGHRIKQFQDKCQQFVRKTIGKKYKFSPMYLLSNQYEKKQQTYFCSQLLAECLRYCKMVQFQRPSYSILPRDFNIRKSQNEDIDMEITQDGKKDADFIGQIYEQVKMLNMRQTWVTAQKQNY